MDEARVREKTRELRDCVRELEREMDRGDNYQIGASLYKLKAELEILYQLVHVGDGKQLAGGPKP